MVGSSLTSLLARSGVSLDFDLASVCQEMKSRQQHDEKTPEGYYMLWRCYSSRRGVNAKISKPGACDLHTPLMSLASSISLGQVCHLITYRPFEASIHRILFGLQGGKREGDHIVFLVKKTFQIKLDRYPGGPQLHHPQTTST